MMEDKQIKCKGCGKTPEEIDEYVSYGLDEGLSATEYVKQEEGTYNPKVGLFYCTECYCNAGMPLGVANE